MSALIYPFLGHTNERCYSLHPEINSRNVIPVDSPILPQQVNISYPAIPISASFLIAHPLPSWGQAPCPLSYFTFGLASCYPSWGPSALPGQASCYPSRGAHIPFHPHLWGLASCYPSRGPSALPGQASCYPSRGPTALPLHLLPWGLAPCYPSRGPTASRDWPRVTTRGGRQPSHFIYPVGFGLLSSSPSLLWGRLVFVQSTPSAGCGSVSFSVGFSLSTNY